MTSLIRSLFVFGLVVLVLRVLLNKINPEQKPSTTTHADFGEQDISNFLHNLQRHLKTQMLPVILNSPADLKPYSKLFIVFCLFHFFMLAVFVIAMIAAYLYPHSAIARFIADLWVHYRAVFNILKLFF